MSNHAGTPRGWLSSATADLHWSGVLLHRDAFVAHGDPLRLQEPPGDLVVVVDGAARPVAEILLIDDAEPQDRGMVMVRLAAPVPNAPSVFIDRPAIGRAWREGRPTWAALLELGVVPVDEPEPVTMPVARPGRPAAIPVKIVTAAPFDWCTIFWWLC